MQKEKSSKQGRAGTVAAAAALLLVAFMACFVPLGPYKDFKESKRELTQLRLQEKLAIDTKAEEEQNLQRQEEVRQRIAQRPQRFDLGAFMSRVLREAKLAERSDLQSLPPNKRLIENADNLSMVQLKLKGVSLADLVSLLFIVYDSKNLVVLHELAGLRPASGDKGLDCTLIFVAPKG